MRFSASIPLFLALVFGMLASVSLGLSQQDEVRMLLSLPTCMKNCYLQNLNAAPSCKGRANCLCSSQIYTYKVKACATGCDLSEQLQGLSYSRTVCNQ
uniref:CFEM domain-containing protein n=1 Tax=Phakopsora pachyrhizi TaxID=170000 RepID=A0A0S1MJ48_PHAPC